ncbi:MAG TPA: two-component regulator propeller domain-containing protein [Holophaga sp.]|nr:two-component regulator propeller domain-containing protein [Holophaga sp.]
MDFRFRAPFLSLVLAWVAALGVEAGDPFQAARPVTRFTDSRAGLPADTVHALLIDRRGTLWAGTVDGPARHTEYGWEAFPLPGGTRSSFIRSLLEDGEGALWFGTQDGGLWRWKSSHWSHFEAERDLPSNRVNCLLETQEPGGGRVLWAGTSRGVARFQGGRWARWGQGLDGGMVWKLREIREPDGRTRLWAAAQGGLFVLEGDAWRRVGRIQGFPAEGASDLLQVPHGDGRTEVWAACWGYGLVRWDGRTWSPFPAPSRFPTSFPTSLALGQGPDGKPTVWAGTFDASLAWFDGTTWHSLSHGELGSASGIYALEPLRGSRPDFVLGSRGSGVGFLDQGGWRILDESCGLPGLEVNAFAETEDAFWIGTARGLVRWGPRGPDTERLSPGLSSIFVSTLHPTREDGRERLWAGTLQGLFVREGNRWRKEAPLPMLGTMIHALLETPGPGGARLWAATADGVACRERGRWRQVLPRPGDPAFTALSLCVSGGPAGDPYVWVGTRGRGLLRLQGDQVSLEAGAGSLPNPSLYGLAATTGKGGRTWLWGAMPGGGLGRLETGVAGAQWEIFTPANTPSLATRFISGLLTDRAGRLYALTTRGVARITLQDRNGVPALDRVETYTTGDGLPTNTLAANTGYQDRAGRIWVGTPKGAAVLDPALERQAAPLLAPSLSRILVDNRPWAEGAALVFPHGMRRLVLEFPVSALHRREDVRYRTWIQGLEKEPAPWQPESRRELAGLPAGRYHLRVTALDHAGRETEALDVPFRVLPAPWLSPLAMAAYVVAGLAAGVGILRWRTRWLLARNEALKAAVEQRTRVITAQSQDLALRNEELRELNQAKESLIQDLQGALNEVRTLEGMIPICSYCKKIRNDSGSWDQLEHYLARKSGASFSHGVCPDCRDQVLSELRKD